MWINPGSFLKKQLLDTHSQKLLPGSPLDVRIPVNTNVDRRRITGISSQWLSLRCKVAKDSWKTRCVTIHRRIPRSSWYRLKNLTTLKNVYGPGERGNSLLVQLKNNHPKSFPGGNSCYLSSQPTYLFCPLRSYRNLYPDQ